MSSIGSRIKAARKRRRISQKTLANCICKCPSAISGYENDFQIPPVDVLISIAKVLGVSVDYLVGFQAQETYAINDLSSNQKEVIDLIFAEFAAPTNNSTKLSAQQIEILQKLLIIFSQKNV